MWLDAGTGPAWHVLREVGIYRLLLGHGGAELLVSSRWVPWRR